MPTLQASENYYREQQRVTSLTLAAARRTWARVSLDDLDGSFRPLVPVLYATITAGQVTAAENGGRYVTAALAEQGIRDAPDGTLRPRSLAGMASDGRPLESLLRAPVAAVKMAVGARVADPLSAGSWSLDRIVATQMADAGRMGTSVASFAQRNVQGYVRTVNLPACGRCLILAGRYYRTDAGFPRHPRCDCSLTPTNDRGFTTDPMDGFNRMAPAEQDKAFTVAGAQAIRDGADPARVVNARSGMTTAATGAGRRLTRDSLGAFSTRAGTTRRGRLPEQRKGYRLMPESIYDLASDRTEAIRLLHRNGYIR